MQFHTEQRVNIICGIQGSRTLIAIAAIAQLGERQAEDLKVPSSIPGLGIFLNLQSPQGPNFINYATCGWEWRQQKSWLCCFLPLPAYARQASGKAWYSITG